MIREQNINGSIFILISILIFFPAALLPEGYGSTTQSSTEINSILTSLRYWTTPTYVRIVIDLDKQSFFTHKIIRKEDSAVQFDQICIEISHSNLGKEIKNTTSINNQLIKRIRAEQISSELSRIIIDVHEIKDYRIFTPINPFRIVSDIMGAPKSQVIVNKEPPNLNSGVNKQYALPVHRICIDPGFGGKDVGALSCKKGVYGKDVNLQISRKLAKRIREELHLDIIMTRTDDQFVTLEQRTALANMKRADLFVSIHCNAHQDQGVYGIETYFLNLVIDANAVKVVAKGNANSEKNIKDLQIILNDLMLNTRIAESRLLARYVQSSLYKHMKDRYSFIKNRGIKQAPFYVLIGAEMPSILIEVSFISNPRECKRLISDQYQEDLAEAIVKGIGNYIKEINLRKQGDT